MNWTEIEDLPASKKQRQMLHIYDDTHALDQLASEITKDDATALISLIQKYHKQRYLKYFEYNGSATD